MFGWTVGKPALIQQGIEQRVDPHSPGDFVVLEGSLEVAGRPRSGNQNVSRTHVKPHHIYRESEDVVQRKGRKSGLFAGCNVAAEHLKRLHRVGHEVSVREHRTLGHTGCSPGVLEGRQGVWSHALEITLRLSFGTDFLSRLQRILKGRVGDRNLWESSGPHLLHQANNAGNNGSEEL